MPVVTPSAAALASQPAGSSPLPQQPAPTFARQPAAAQEPTAFQPSAPVTFAPPQAPAAPAAPQQPQGAARQVGSMPLVRRPAPEPVDQPGAGYVSDSVEARSDWIASAVLYEEMSTLMRNGPEVQGRAYGESAGTYSPQERPDVTTSGLTRRARTVNREEYVDQIGRAHD